MFFHHAAVVGLVQDGEFVSRKGDHVGAKFEVEGAVEGGFDKWFLVGGCGGEEPLERGGGCSQ